jgi:hypothetical protein
MFLKSVWLAEVDQVLATEATSQLLIILTNMRNGMSFFLESLFFHPTSYSLISPHSCIAETGR